MKVRRFTSGFIAVMVLCGTVTYYNKVSASGYPLLTLRPNGQKIYEAYAGEFVELQYNVSGVEYGWCSSGIHFKYDARLDIELKSDDRILFEKGDAGSDIRSYEVRMVNPDFFPDKIDGLSENENCVFISTSCEGDYGYDGTIATFYFKVPYDAQPGDSYKFDFLYMQNDMFTDRDRNQEMQEYAFSNWDGGIIQIPIATTTTTNSTTTTTTTSTTTTTTTTNSMTTTTSISTATATTLSSTATKPVTTSTTSTSTSTNITTTLVIYTKGDANNDGLVDVADVVAISAYVGNSEANPLDIKCIKNADVHNTGDGLTANDALMVQQYIAKIIDNL